MGSVTERSIVPDCKSGALVATQVRILPGPPENLISSHGMNLKKSITISIAGTFIEAVGMGLDIMHHIDIGIKSPEGLLTPFHGLIFAGFVINFIGVLLTFVFLRREQKHTDTSKPM